MSGWIYQGMPSTADFAATCRMTEAHGCIKVVQHSTCYGSETEMRAFDLSRFAAESEQATLRGILDLETLAAGAYRCTHTCHIAPGAEITVRDFEFTK